MKVLLTAINSKFIHSNLAIRYLKAYTKDLNYDCKIREFSINDREEKILEEIIKEKPDIVAFSTYIWNIGAGGGNRTRISSLEGLGNNHYTMPAYNFK